MNKTDKQAFTSKLKLYYQLTKPGIIYGNLLTALAGFLLGSHWHIHPWLLLGMLVGTALVIGSACVFNNYIDRTIDAKMARTKKRALVINLIKASHALIYASVLGILGFLLLIFLTNWLTVLCGIIAIVDYIFLYGWAKRHTVHSTLVGSIAGAMPLVAGYTAAVNRINAATGLLFLILVCWQMPHFYAIALYRFADYKAAGLPVLPIKKSVLQAKIQITIFILGFTLASLGLTIFGYTGYSYLVIMAALSLWWLVKAFQGFRSKDTSQWARKMFFISLIVNLTFCLVLAVGTVLP